MSRRVVLAACGAVLGYAALPLGSWGETFWKVAVGFVAAAIMAGRARRG